ncbi:MAG: electron transfer flavoprotein subunit beta/FixA family protein [Bacteroidaceae bacterium]|nr:electron transfer flavoprotein subunit beta/FixA family protein [Bacteroidaceae bacterium]
MKLNIIVLAKQVPDTRNVGPDAMTPEGTVNRSALPAIFNPEDLNALEQALRLKDQFPGTTVTVLTMGPGRAAEVIREAMYRGADGGYLLTDRAFAGADTLATSYALATAIKHVCPNVDLIIGGRQAIDGDTAQVGPQVAEKLGLNQITYVEEIKSLRTLETLKTLETLITVKRHIDGGVETVESPLPCVLTVNGSAAPCRPRNVKRVMKYKRCLAPMELPQGTGFGDLPYAAEYEKKPYLKLGQLSCADVNADLQQCGLAGSPTKVKNVENIVFKAKESKVLTGSDEDVNGLIKELLNERLIG